MPRARKPEQWKDLRDLLIAVVCLPVFLCLALVWLIAHMTYSMLLYPAIWILWNTRGIRALYVYSNSPNWQEHVENEILPRLPRGTIVLNWSERKRWKWLSLSAMLFRHFGGSREFNPMAIVLRPFRRAKVFRFYEAFQDFKHGKPDSVDRLETELIGELGREE